VYPTVGYTTEDDLIGDIDVHDEGEGRGLLPAEESAEQGMADG